MKKGDGITINIKSSSKKRTISSVGGDNTTTSRKRKASTTEAAALSSSSSSSSSSFGLCESVSSRYEKLGRVGQGTYGVVYKARDKQTGNYVALKKCHAHHEKSDGFPLTTLREIHALKLCSRHEHIVDLLTVAVSSQSSSSSSSSSGSSGGGVFLVCEYCPQDLAQIMDDSYPLNRQSPFDQSQVKTLMKQLLSALAFCHSHALIHRDIKPSNMLYVDGKLKLCDFGLSRHIYNGSDNNQNKSRLTPNVVSLWYRAPELLLQQNHSTYTFGIDMWAVGCVFGELLQGYPLLDGRDEIDQISKMTASLGMPPRRLYADCQVSPASPPHHSSHHNDLWDRFSNLSTESLTLLTKLLEYDPTERYQAQEALDCDYFTSKPFATKDMPRFDHIEMNSR